MMTDEQRDAVVAQARLLLGTRFYHAGRNGQGLDCIGLLVVATRNAGLSIYDNTSYSPVVNSEYMQSELSLACDRLPDSEPLRRGDVLLFSVGGSPQHIAMVTETEPEVAIIHSYQTVGRVVEHRLDETWTRRMVAAYVWRAH